MQLQLVLFAIIMSVAEACRIIAFAGNEPVSGRKLLFESENSLPALAYDHPFLPALDKSKHWDESQCGLRNSHENRDGWGVGWYPEETDAIFPLRFRTHESIVTKDNSTVEAFLEILDGNHEISKISEATENIGFFKHSQGLLDDSLTVGSCGVETKQTPRHPLESRVVFGHVRKATSTVDETNAHPFVFNHLLFMHNGMLGDFESYSGKLLRRLRPAVRGMIQGNVDSEVAGALFCNNLEGFPKRLDYSMAEMRGAMRTLVAELRAFSAEASLNRCHEVPVNDTKDEALSFWAQRSWSPSSMNFAVTDGKGLIVTRFRSKEDEDPPSLYYKLGIDVRYKKHSDENMEPVEIQNHTDDLKFDGFARSWSVDGLVVASEPLEESPPHLSAWRLLGKDKMISFHPHEGVRIECLSHKCTSDHPISDL